MDTTTFISALGVFAAMAGMAILIFKRVSPILIGPMAAILVCLTSQIPVFKGVTETYMSGVTDFFLSYFFIFLLGNIFGNLYQNSGSRLQDRIDYFPKIRREKLYAGMYAFRRDSKLRGD